MAVISVRQRASGKFARPRIVGAAVLLGIFLAEFIAQGFSRLAVGVVAPDFNGQVSSREHDFTTGATCGNARGLVVSRRYYFRQYGLHGRRFFLWF